MKTRFDLTLRTRLGALVSVPLVVEIGVPTPPCAELVSALDDAVQDALATLRTPRARVHHVCRIPLPPEGN